MAVLVSKPLLSNANITDSNIFQSAITTAGAYATDGIYGYPIGVGYSNTPTFVGAGETVVAIGLELAGIAAVAGTTLGIYIRNATDGVSSPLYSYDVNTNLNVAGGRGWYFFVIPGGGTVFTAGKSWNIIVGANANSRLTLMRSTVATDFNRIYVTNNDATFTTGDSVYLAGRCYTTGNPESSSLIYNTSLSANILTVNTHSSLNWTADNLTMTITGSTGSSSTGSLVVNPGGSFRIGTALAPVNGLIQFANTAVGANGFSVYGPATFEIYGTNVSSDYSIDLASTANASQANAVLTSVPDWVAGQTVVYSTSRGTGGEVRTISSVSGNTVTNTTNFAVIHDVRTVGTYTTINDVAVACLLDRGFVVGNTSTATGTWYGSIYGAVSCTWSNVYFRDYGANAGPDQTRPSKSGWTVDITTGGSFNVTNCSFYTSAQVNTYCISSENSTARRSIGYNISSCFFISRTPLAISLLINGADDANHVFADCIALCVGGSTNSCYLTRASNSGNVTITNFKSIGFYNLIQRNEATAGKLGSITVDNCFHCGQGFYTSTNAATNPSTSFYIGNVNISNCIALNRISAAGTSAVRFDTLNQPLVTFQQCKFLGYNRYFYGTETVSRTVLFDQCHFEDDTVASNTAITIGAAQRINVAFKSCFFYTTLANQSFILANWTSFPVYINDGRLMFQDCSFNGDGSLFLTLATSKYFYGYTATLDNCLFRGSGATINGKFIKMGKVLDSTDTFSGTGTSVAITPTSNNEASFPFSHRFALPTTSTGALTVNFKTKSYSLNGTVTAYIENNFGVLTQSALTVSSSWDSQSLSTTLSSACKEALYLTLELTGTSGYMVVDEITTASSAGPLGIDGVTMFLPEATIGGGGETTSLFC